MSDTAGGPLSPVDRSAAFAEDNRRVPRKVVFIGLAVVLALGLGGTLLEHVFSVTGLNSAPSARASSASTSVPGAPSETGSGHPAVSASLSSFMGLEHLRGGAAPAFFLTDAGGNPVSLAGLRGSVVVLTFFDAGCNDICSVEAAELRQAAVDLGVDAPRVRFLTVNCDPRATDAASIAATGAASGLASDPQWTMLTGPLPVLNAVWQQYGISVQVDRANGAVVHDNALYFVDPHGDLRLRATPFADEGLDGAFSLPADDQSRWAEGIAHYAQSLLS